jgi:hypothetical protein
LTIYTYPDEGGDTGWDPTITYVSFQYDASGSDQSDPTAICIHQLRRYKHGPDYFDRSAVRRGGLLAAIHAGDSSHANPTPTPT